MTHADMQVAQQHTSNSQSEVLQGYNYPGILKFSDISSNYVQ